MLTYKNALCSINTVYDVKYVVKKIFCTILSVVALACFAKQDIKSEIFKDGDNFCLVGDSITHGGFYTQSLLNYYATRLPRTKINFYNFGVSGDYCGGILDRIDTDISKVKADVYTLMIGMNDVGRTKFSPKNADDPKLQKKIADTRKIYSEQLKKVVDYLAAHAPKLIIFTPSIYDQVSASKTENYKGVNDELFQFGEIGRAYAKELNAPVVDMWAATNEVNNALVKIDPKKSVVSEDRVHPDFAGGYVMAAKFLTDMKEPALVSETVIDALKKTATAKNADLSDVQFGKKISFISYEYALPFALADEQKQVEQIVKFSETHNRQILAVKGLEQGKYALSIDGMKIGEFSAQQLQNGVNLAEFDTPQMRQAKDVEKLCREYKLAAERARGIVATEFFGKFKKLGLKTDEERIAKARELAETTKHRYIRSLYKKYPNNKPRQKEFEKAALDAQARVYLNAQPVTHRFVIEKI